MPQNAPFSWLTKAQARQQLLLRLNSTGVDLWSNAELDLYLAESLRYWNCLTQTWVQDWTTSYTPSAAVWQSTANSVNPLVGSNPSSPRFQTLSDSYVYTLAQYHLLEPPTGSGTWVGTNQFSLTDFIQSFTNVRDNILQITGCNIGPFSSSFSVLPGANRIALPDSTSLSVLDLRRIRFLPDSSTGVLPSTLFRDDTLAMEFFENDYQQNFNIPVVWDVIGSPPQEITFDALVSVPNTLDILAMLSGGEVSPPASSPLLIPDDFFWVIKWGILADLLAKEPESSDPERAAYCAQRYAEGIRLMTEMPWLLQGQINRVPVDTVSVAEMDDFAYEWQTDPTAPPTIVRGGVDLFAVCPSITQNLSVTLSLIGNAPVPVADGDFMQVSKDVFNVILDYAHHLASFKMAGAEFKETIPLAQGMVAYAMNVNRRLRESGIFPTTLKAKNSRQDASQPRFAMEETSS